MNDAAKLSENLQLIASELDARIEALMGKRVAFSLFVWTDGRSNYVSTADRSEIIPVIEEHLRGWKAGMPDVPAHRYKS